MIAASLFIIVCSARNRARVRLRRLREPRYLLGAIVGIAYFYFSFFARARTSGASAARRSARRAGGMPPQLAALVSAGPAFAGLGLLAATALSWILPVESGLLEFSDAEVQFLFTAPVSRRQLLIHRMLRSQLGLLFAAIVFGIATPSVGGFTRLRLSIAMWVLLVTGKIYQAGITLARTRLGSRSAHARRVAWTPIVVLTAAVATVTIAVVRAFSEHPPARVVDSLLLIGQVPTHGAAHVVLWPFMVLARPVFAAWPQPYLSALAWAVLVLVLTIAWVLKSDQAFLEATAAGAERREHAPAARNVSYRVRSEGWALATTGRAEAAFAWKAAMQTTRVVDRRSLARLAAILVSLSMIAMSMGRANGLAATLGIFASIGTAFAILLAPQAVRVDMRQDLRHLEVLKTWPVPPAAVVRGEIIWPGALITVCAWLFLAIALLMSATAFPTFASAFRVSVGMSIAILTPALVFAQLTIHNGVALLFPAWVPLGGQRPRGLDAMGQRMIMLAGTMLLLIVMLLPGAIAGGIVWFAFTRFIGASALVPAAVVCAGIVAVEVLLATEALGPAYERIDIMAVERAE
jgi:hypothetical protein